MSFQLYDGGAVELFCIIQGGVYVIELMCVEMNLGQNNEPTNKTLNQFQQHLHKGRIY